MSTIIDTVSDLNHLKSRSHGHSSGLWEFAEFPSDIRKKIADASRDYSESSPSFLSDGVIEMDTNEGRYQQADAFQGVFLSYQEQESGLPAALQSHVTGTEDNEEPHEPFRITPLYNWSEEEISHHLAYIKHKFLGWDRERVEPKNWWPIEAANFVDTEVSRLFWKEIEATSSQYLSSVVRLAEELARRHADTDDIVLAFVTSDTLNIQANLTYIDLLRLQSELLESKRRLTKHEHARTLLQTEHLEREYQATRADWYSVQSQAQTAALSSVEEADAIYLAGLERFPESAPLLTCYAEFLEDVERNSDEVLHFVRHALAIDSDYALARSSLGRALLRVGEIEGAINEFSQGIRLDPYYSSIHRNLGRAYAAKADWTAARNAYDKAIELDPDVAVAYALRGDVAIQEEAWETAFNDYRLATQIDPEEPSFQCRLGNLLYYFEDFESAVEAYEAAVTLDRSYTSACINLCSALSKVGRSSEAIEFGEWSIEMDPKNGVGHYNLACAYALSEEIKHAVASLQTAIQLVPSLRRTANKDKDLVKIVRLIPARANK